MEWGLRRGDGVWGGGRGGMEGVGGGDETRGWGCVVRKVRSAGEVGSKSSVWAAMGVVVVMVITLLSMVSVRFAEW